MATLNGELREKLGTRPTKKLRLQGRIPCSIQGEGKPNVDLSINESEFMALRRQHENLFDITVSSETENVLVRELQWDTITERVLHVEFRRVVLGRKTEVEVELSFRGHPKGGVLNHLVTHVTVLAKPREIPEHIVVPVDGLEEGQSIHASDLVLEGDVDLVTDPETMIATVAAPKGIEEETPEEEGLETEVPIAGEAPAEDSEATPEG